MTSITVPNPWGDLPREDPIVATADRRLFDQHPEWRNKMELGRLPTPFLGTPEATVFVLSLNPSGGDVDSD
jgi:hypothetical protein